MRLHVNECLDPQAWRVINRATGVPLDSTTEPVVQADDDEGWVDEILLGGYQTHRRHLPIEIQLCVDGVWVKPTREQAEPRLKRWTATQVMERQHQDLMRGMVTNLKVLDARARQFPEEHRPQDGANGSAIVAAVTRYIHHLESELSTARSLMDRYDINLPGGGVVDVDVDQVEVTSVRELLEGSADAKDDMLVETDGIDVWVAARLRCPGDMLELRRDLKVTRARRIYGWDVGREVKIEPVPREQVYDDLPSTFASGAEVKGGLAWVGERGCDLAIPPRPLVVGEVTGLTKAECGLVVRDNGRHARVIGKVRNIEPPYKSASGRAFTFGHALESIDAVYVDGVPLKLCAEGKVLSAPDEYRVFLYRGEIILGAKPKGRVTCDVVGPPGVQGSITFEVNNPTLYEQFMAVSDAEEAARRLHTVFKPPAHDPFASARKKIAAFGEARGWLWQGTLREFVAEALNLPLAEVTVSRDEAGALDVYCAGMRVYREETQAPTVASIREEITGRLAEHFEREIDRETANGFFGVLDKPCRCVLRYKPETTVGVPAGMRLEPLKADPNTVVYAGRGFGKTEKVEGELAKARAAGATVVRLGGPKVHKPWPGRLTGELMSNADVMKLGEPEDGSDGQ